jgi:EthD domain
LAYRSGVEKLVYVGWKPDGVALGDFRKALLGPVATRLLEAGARGLTLLLADEQAVQGSRIAQRDPTAVVGVWVDSATQRAPLEAELAAAMTGLAGWLTLESVPLRNTTQPVGRGERLPGLYTVAFLEKPAALDHATWLQRWQGEHTAVALATQRTFQYVQNVLVRAVTADAPPWAAIVEEAFPAEAATDPMRFYAASTPAELAAQQRRMTASCERFIDFARFETLPMSAYVLAHPTC